LKTQVYIWNLIFILNIISFTQTNLYSQDINYWRSLEENSDAELSELVSKSRTAFRALTVSESIENSDSIYNEYRSAIILQGNPTNINRFLNDTGVHHTNLDSSIYYYQIAIDFILEEEATSFDMGTKITSMCNLGMIYNQELGNPKKAIPILEEALVISDKYHYPGIKLSIIRNLASIYNKQGDKSYAIKLAESGLEDFKYTNYFVGPNGVDYYTLSRFLGSLYADNQDVEIRKLGFKYINDALTFFSEENNHEEVSLALSDLANYYPDLLEKGQDLIYLDKALAYYKEKNSSHLKKHIQLTKGVVLARNGYQKESKQQLDDLLKTYPDDSTAMNKTIQFHLYKSNKQNKNYEEALSNHENYLKIKELEVEKYFSDEVLQLRTKYDTARKSRVAQLLRSKNRTILRYTLASLLLLLITTFSLIFLWQNRKKIKRQNQELENLNKSKNDLFLILAHDLKGPLFSFGNISNRVGQLLKNKDFAGLDKLSNYYSKVGEETKYAVSNLLDWSLSQKDNFLLHRETIEIETELTDIQKDLNYLILDKNMTIRTHNSGVKQVWCDKNSFIIIYRNLLHNAIKYSSKDSYVDLKISTQNDKVIIEIENITNNMSTEVFESIQKLIEKNQDLISLKMRDSGIGIQTAVRLIKHNNGDIEFSKTGDKFSVTTSFYKNQISFHSSIS